MFDHKKAILLDIDNVLFPKQDYLIQVYYMFANLLEFTEGKQVGLQMTQFMKTHLLQQGELGVFEAACNEFGFSSSFANQFDRLHYQAQLPVPLLLYPKLKTWLLEWMENGTFICLYTDQDPALQLNKLKHLEWPTRLAQNVQVYFEKELTFRGLHPIEYLLDQFKLNASDVVFISDGNQIPMGIQQSSIETVSIQSLELNQ
jgi:FMN phosphatase YigB (HAD superfamily)